MSLVYLASSWRNPFQSEAVFRLRNAGHLVYDFRNPTTPWDSVTLGDSSGGFAWSAIDPDWERWSPWSFRQALTTETAAAGFANDWGVMEDCEVGVLLLPCGRSAHLEAGYFAGTPGKRLYIVAPVIDEPELMYLMADRIFPSIEELIESGVLDEESSSWAMASPAPRTHCSEHADGTTDDCGPCWTARRAQASWRPLSRVAVTLGGTAAVEGDASLRHRVRQALARLVVVDGVEYRVQDTPDGIEFLIEHVETHLHGRAVREVFDELAFDVAKFAPVELHYSVKGGGDRCLLRLKVVLHDVVAHEGVSDAVAESKAATSDPSSEPTDGEVAP